MYELLSSVEHLLIDQVLATVIIRWHPPGPVKGMEETPMSSRERIVQQKRVKVWPVGVVNHTQIRRSQ